MKMTKSLVLIILACISGVCYELYTSKNEIKQLHDGIESLKLSLRTSGLGIKTKNQELPAHENAIGTAKTSSWISVQRKVKDTVVQIFAQTTAFNWFEPYKTPQQGESTGSAFIINEDGDMITNYHVVAQAATIRMQIPCFGLEQFDVEIIGVSPDRDLALLKMTDETRKRIKTKLDPIPYLKLGDSDDVVRSQEVLALGYPLGQSRLKSTLGNVSGRERMGYFGYFQITAPLNPGNSGGPTVNADGEVIGINRAGIIEAQNVGYSIPINEVKTALRDLPRIRLIRKPVLGCLFTYASQEMVRYLNNPDDGGWYIAQVFDNTLFKNIGIQEDDMLYEINGHRIDVHGELDVPWSEDKVSLFELMNRYTVGDTMSLKVYREGKPRTFTFKLENNYLPAIRTVYPEFEKNEIEYEVFGGMVVMPLSLNHVGILLSDHPDLVRYARPEAQHEPALLITHIQNNSQAHKSRVLRRGEIISEINGTPVKTLAEFRQAVKESRQNGYLTVKTMNKLYAVLSLNKVLHDEDMLAARNFYQKSALVQELQSIIQIDHNIPSHPLTA